jgi:lipopolysaccharide export system protein LptA
MTLRRLALALCFITSFAAPILAADKAPVDIEAGEMEILSAENRTIFRGDVVVLRGGDRIQCDNLVVTNSEVKQPDGTTKSEASILDAKGNVRITTKSQVITGSWAKMNLQANTLVVGGSAKVVQGSTVVRGDKIVVDLNTKNTTISGGRVKGSFVPK